MLNPFLSTWMNSCLWSATEDEIGNHNSRVSYCIWVIRNMDFDIDFFFLYHHFLLPMSVSLWPVVWDPQPRQVQRPEGTWGNQKAPLCSQFQPWEGAACSLQWLSSLVLQTHRSAIPDHWDSGLGTGGLPEGSIWGQRACCLMCPSPETFLERYQRTFSPAHLSLLLNAPFILLLLSFPLHFFRFLTYCFFLPTKADSILPPTAELHGWVSSPYWRQQMTLLTPSFQELWSSYLKKERPYTMMDNWSWHSPPRDPTGIAWAGSLLGFSWFNVYPWAAWRAAWAVQALSSFSPLKTQAPSNAYACADTKKYHSTGIYQLISNDKYIHLKEKDHRCPRAIT